MRGERTQREIQQQMHKNLHKNKKLTYQPCMYKIINGIILILSIFGLLFFILECNHVHVVHTGKFC